MALVTDGRMSGASGKVPAAIHVSPEAMERGAISRLQDGDLILMDADRGILQVEVDEREWGNRQPAQVPDLPQDLGRNLFQYFRREVGSTTRGASVLGSVDVL